MRKEDTLPIVPPYFNSPFGAPGDRLLLKETFWAKHDTEWDEMSGSTTDWGPHLDLGEKYHPGIDYVASPSCMNPPPLEYQQTVCKHNGVIVPGDWWLSPPNDWNGGDDDHKQRGEWVFLEWEHYSKIPCICMPKWAIRHRPTVLTVRACMAKDINIKGTVWDKQPYKNEGFHMAAMTEMYHYFGDENVWVWYCEMEVVK
jgi:hypothetical protein